jgi:hypothetical protein
MMFEIPNELYAEYQNFSRLSGETVESVIVRGLECDIDTWHDVLKSEELD